MKNDSTLRLYRLLVMAMLIAIMFVLQLTGLGFILIPPVSVTTLIIPVVAGAIALGPGYGAALGLVFGGMSMYNATVAATSPIDMAFSPIYATSFWGGVSSVVMCIGCRVLFGFMTGLLFRIFYNHLFKRLQGKRFARRTVSTVLASILGVLIHTSTVMSCLWLLFPNLGVEFKAVVSTVASLNFVAEAGFATVFAFALSNILPVINKDFRE